MPRLFAIGLQSIMGKQRLFPYFLRYLLKWHLPKTSKYYFPNPIISGIL